MDLEEAIKKCSIDFGESIITEIRFINILSDYKAFDNNQFAKLIIKLLIDNNFTKQLLDESFYNDYNFSISKIIYFISSNYGIKEELIRKVILSIVKGIGKREENENEELIKPNAEGELKQNNEYTNKSSENILPYSERFIASLYEPIFARHYHIKPQYISEVLHCNDNELNNLLIFLCKIGAIEYNKETNDFTSPINSEEMLIYKYRGKVPKFRYLEHAIKRLYDRGFTNIDILVFDLKLDKSIAIQIFNLLLNKQIINKKGVLLNTFIPYSVIAEEILSQLEE